MFGGEAGKTWNTLLELKFCHQMCLIRNRFSPEQIRKRREEILKNWLILNASFKSRWLWNSARSRFKYTTWEYFRAKSSINLTFLIIFSNFAWEQYLQYFPEQASYLKTDFEAQSVGSKYFCLKIWTIAIVRSHGNEWWIPKVLNQKKTLEHLSL